MGDTRNVLAANVLGNGVNVVCNALLIYGLGHFPRLGVLGAGLGTAVGAGGTLTYTLALFLRRGCPASLRGAGRWLPERSYLRALGPLTAGTFLEQAAERAGMFTFSSGTGDDGTEHPQHLRQPVRHLLQLLTGAWKGQPRSSRTGSGQWSGG